jgi:exodeoxyribonuclease VII large subunit
MSEKIADKTVYSLLEVAKSIQKTISDRYTSEFWVKAEMNKLNHYSHSGHCYPELVEKQDGKVIAQFKANLWRDDYQTINANFIRVLNEPLKDGIKILFLARISFEPQYGLSLRIIDIDPSFTLGDLEKEKQETIQRLHAEGIFSSNKMKAMPLLPQRIAIISVETSKGYADFTKVLSTNPWNYHFFHVLFPSLLQGDRAVESIRHQLRRIRKVISHFDVVAIIRGGGGDIGLSCYNHYDLARDIALFPIPIITGIGHATNETVVEMISHANAITPTKIAEYLLLKFHEFAIPVQKAEEKIRSRAERILNDEKYRLQSAVKLFRSVTTNVLAENRGQVRSLNRMLQQQTTFMIRNEKGLLNSIEKNIANLSQHSVLKRGFSITYKDGKSVKSSDELTEGDIVQTIFAAGSIISIVQSTGKQNTP